MSVSDERQCHKYRVRHKDGVWMVGDSTVEIDESYDFQMKCIRYRGTRGLYEVMFMKYPEEYVYDKNDLSEVQDHTANHQRAKK